MWKTGAATRQAMCLLIDASDLPATDQMCERHPDTPVVIDHFARISCAEGLDAPAFKALLRLVGRDNCWAKLMGPYFVSDVVPSFADIAPFAQKMIATAPDRMLWGSDWPHPSGKEKMPDDGHLADLLADWAPDETQRKKILVDNPARLYGFK